MKIKLSNFVKDIKDSIITEGDLKDWPGYNTPAALKKEEEIEKDNINVKPEDSITDLDLNTLNRNVTIKEYSYGPLNQLKHHDVPIVEPLIKRKLH